MKQLPYIRVANREAVCGFALRALLSERLLGADPAQRFVQAHQNQARLMALVARWQHPLTLELHMTARPSLDSAVMGHVRLAVVTRVSGATREEALERDCDEADPERVERIHRLGRRHDPLVEDHAFIHQRLQTFSTSGAVLSAGSPPLV